MRTLINALIILFSLTLLNCKQSDPIETEYTLVWEDLFGGNAIDTINNWEFQIGDGANYGLWRWGNNEDQYYRKENARVSNGKLLIKAVAEDYNGYSYTSARMRTKGKVDFKYGKIEAMIRMANTKGLWHAFWLLPSNPSQNWPMSGEIDIMEYVGNAPHEILNTLHFADNFDNHQYIGSATPFTEDNQFHLYSIEWDENKIIWYQAYIEKDKTVYPDSGVMFIPVRHQDCSLKSEEEAEKIKQLIKLLLSSKYKLATDKEKFISEEDILIIAPFNVQVNYLKRKLNKKLKIGTVDNFQGQEALISIFSLTSSSGEDAPRGLDFLLEPNRLNVAISRAKILSIIVGSPSLAKSFCQTSEEVEKLNRLIRLMRTGNS